MKLLLYHIIIACDSHCNSPLWRWVDDFLHYSELKLFVLQSLVTREVFFVPVPRGVCRWCFAAAPAAPGAAAWLSPAGDAGLYSYCHSPSTKEAKHKKNFYLISSVVVFSCHKSKCSFYSHFVHLSVSVLSSHNSFTNLCCLELGLRLFFLSHLHTH